MFLRSTVVMKLRIVFNYYGAILIVRSLFKIFLFCLMSHYSFFKCDSYNILLESAYFSGCCNLSYHTILLFYIQYEYFLSFGYDCYHSNFYSNFFIFAGVQLVQTYAEELLGIQRY